MTGKRMRGRERDRESVKRITGRSCPFKVRSHALETISRPRWDAVCQYHTERSNHHTDSNVQCTHVDLTAHKYGMCIVIVSVFVINIIFFFSPRPGTNVRAVFVPVHAIADRNRHPIPWTDEPDRCGSGVASRGFDAWGRRKRADYAFVTLFLFSARLKAP